MEFNITEEDLELLHKYFDIPDKRVDGLIIVKDRSTGKVYKKFKTIPKYCDWEYVAIQTLKTHYK